MTNYKEAKPPNVLSISYLFCTVNCHVCGNLIIYITYDLNDGKGVHFYSCTDIGWNKLV